MVAMTAVILVAVYRVIRGIEVQDHPAFRPGRHHHSQYPPKASLI